MPAMLQVTVELPLGSLSEAGFPVVLLRSARRLRFLRQDRYGFQVSYGVQASRTLAFSRRLRRQYESVQGTQRLSWDEQDGRETLLIRGRWTRHLSVKERDRAAKTLRALSGCQDQFVRTPQVVGKTLRVSIAGERSRIMRALARFDRLKVPHRVAGRAAPSGRAQTPSIAERSSAVSTSAAADSGSGKATPSFGYRSITLRAPRSPSSVSSSRKNARSK